MLKFFEDKKVFVTGHTGFKGTWLCKMLIDLGAQVTGCSLYNEEDNKFFKLSKIEKDMNSIIGDIRDFELLKKAIIDFKPDIVFHLAAQPLVRESYIEPRYTYDVNVMGTVNLLECVRECNSIKSIVNVTTDKVYYNNEWVWGYRESDILDGFDPYSNSKSCSELVSASYNRSFFDKMNISLSTVRAGNVIGGGDFSKDRIIPDCLKDFVSNETIKLRNPNSVRPYQHVLEPIYVYLLIAMKQYFNKSVSGSYNVGPDENDCVSTEKLVEIFCKVAKHTAGWEKIGNDGPHEAGILKLDCSKLKVAFNWQPRWNVRIAVEKTLEWHNCFVSNGNIKELMSKQINDFMRC